jgi:hypothetical protein
MRIAAIFVLVLCSCGKQNQEAPPSLGRFQDLEAWQRECAMPLIETRTCGLLPYTASCGAEPAPFADPPVHFGSAPTAVRMLACPPPGWALYLDSQDRVVAFCADDVLAGSSTESHYAIAYRLAEQRLGKDVAAALSKREERRGWLTWRYSTGASYRPDGRRINDARFAADYGQTRCWAVTLDKSTR